MGGFWHRRVDLPIRKLLLALGLINQWPAENMVQLGSRGLKLGGAVFGIILLLVVLVILVCSWAGRSVLLRELLVDEAILSFEFGVGEVRTA